MTNQIKKKEKGPHPMSTPTAAGMMASTDGMTQPTVDPLPTWTSGSTGRGITVRFVRKKKREPENRMGSETDDVAVNEGEARELGELGPCLFFDGHALTKKIRGFSTDEREPIKQMEAAKRSERRPRVHILTGTT